MLSQARSAADLKAARLRLIRPALSMRSPTQILSARRVPSIPLAVSFRATWTWRASWLAGGAVSKVRTLRRGTASEHVEPLIMARIMGRWTQGGRRARVRDAVPASLASVPLSFSRAGTGERLPSSFSPSTSRVDPGGTVQPPTCRRWGLVVRGPTRRTGSCLHSTPAPVWLNARPVRHIFQRG